MVISTLDIEDIIAVGVVERILWVPHADVLGQVIHFLLCNCNCVIEIKAREVYMLKGFINLVDLVEYIPGNIELNLLPNHFNLVLVHLLINLNVLLSYILSYLGV